MKKIYNKLVRDKIPEICRRDGEATTCRLLSGSQFRKALKQKLVEETQELVKENGQKLKGEIVDVYEILLNISKSFGFKWPEIERLRREKNKQRGSFKKRIFLVSSKK